MSNVTVGGLSLVKRTMQSNQNDKASSNPKTKKDEQQLDKDKGNDASIASNDHNDINEENA